MSANPETLLEKEVRRRRTFAIISHPDAGKTTMTEKLLLYGGAIHLAGSVKARKASRHATSDWMEIEKQRGISVTSSVMQFDYMGYCINILDTPGHQDFSEDTYRTLFASDAAVMLIDGAKGVEAQTIKLFQVCRMRQIPIITFINKMDRAAQAPFDLLDELEKVLGIFSYPMNWPIGTDGDFQGIYKRPEKEVELYIDRSGKHGAEQISRTSFGLEDSELKTHLDSHYRSKLTEDLELLDIAGEEFSMERILKGEITPVFFGSAITNFGVEYFLRSFLEMAPAPSARKTSAGYIEASSPDFSGFVFKIQANMDPNHRDRIAFMRICSGAYTKNMEVTHMREKKSMRLAQPQQFLAQEHKLVEEAYAGDIIGLFDPGIFRIGDSLCTPSSNIEFADIPVFPPEHFARIQPKDSMKRKQFLKGMEQLSEEGAVQLYKEPNIGTETFIVGVVGVLQFEVLEHRLLAEYKVTILQTNLNYRHARWVRVDGQQLYDTQVLEDLNLTSTSMRAVDKHDACVILFESDWAINWALERNPGIELKEIQ